MILKLIKRIFEHNLFNFLARSVHDYGLVGGQYSDMDIDG